MAPLTAEQQALVVDNASLARAIARAHSSDDEAESVALLALAKAAARFDPTHGVPVEAFLALCIRRAVRRYLTKKRRELLVPDLSFIPMRAVKDESLPLPDRLQPLARLHFVEGVPLVEAASLLSLSLRKAQAQVASVRRILRFSGLRPDNG